MAETALLAGAVRKFITSHGGAVDEVDGNDSTHGRLPVAHAIRRCSFIHATAYMVGTTVLVDEIEARHQLKLLDRIHKYGDGNGIVSRIQFQSSEGENGLLLWQFDQIIPFEDDAKEIANKLELLIWFASGDIAFLDQSLLYVKKGMNPEQFDRNLRLQAALREEPLGWA